MTVKKANKATDAYQLVIVESPAKAKTIEKYLGPGFLVKASVGHIRDLERKSGSTLETSVAGVDVEKGNFEPVYEVASDKKKGVAELKKLAKNAQEVWFATDLDREGEAIAWHLAVVLDVDPLTAKRVTFDAITKSDVLRAFEVPRPIDMDRVNTQQARRIIDRWLGYPVSGLFRTKIGGNLSAGRVQSVTARIVAEREQEIIDFRPAETWDVSASMTVNRVESGRIADEWAAFMAQRDEKGKPPLMRERMAWRGNHQAFECQLVEVAGSRFEVQAANTLTADIAEQAVAAAESSGLKNIEVLRETDQNGKGRSCNRVRVVGKPDESARYTVESVETKRTKSAPKPPLITSTLQQAASTKLGMSTDKVMRLAQQLYEGIELPDVGRVGLITYMRTDSTNLSAEAIEKARSYLLERHGEAYVPAEPRLYTSSNSSAQEAHEAIRPTDPAHEPDVVAASLTEDQYRVYKLIWESFLSCQATDAEWDSTSVKLRRSDIDSGTVFRAQGRVLKFDGHYAISGVQADDSNQVLPALQQGDELAVFAVDVRQRFESPPPRYTEASLVKKMEQEGIGRPSTYASTINKVEERGYVVQENRRLHATAIGMRATGFLIKGFEGHFIEIAYTRQVEHELDQVASGSVEWKALLKKFYEQFQPLLEEAKKLPHEKGRGDPSPYACPECGRGLEYRLGKNGEFLSCTGYREKVAAPDDGGKKSKKPKETPACSFAMPVDLRRQPLLPEQLDLRSPRGIPMVKRRGRYGDYLTEDLPPAPKAKGSSGGPEFANFTLNVDTKGNIKFPAVPPIVTDLSCSKCGAALNLRQGKKTPWLGCSKFPKCRGREAFAKLPEEQQEAFKRSLDEHLLAHPQLTLFRRDGTTPVLDGTPLSELQIPGGIADLPLIDA
jgi:DNA topoisomerase-1